MPQPEAEPLSALIVEALRLTRTITTLEGIIGGLLPVLTAVTRLGAEVDTDLQPELDTVVDRLGEASEALMRACTFAVTRYNVVADRAGVPQVGEEGGTA